MLFITINLPPKKQPNRRLDKLYARAKRLSERRDNPKRNMAKLYVDFLRSEWNIARTKAEEAIAERGIDLDKLPRKQRLKLLIPETAKQLWKIDRKIRKDFDEKIRKRNEGRRIIGDAQW